MLRRYALFTSLIGNITTLDGFYQTHGEIFMLYGIQVNFMRDEQTGQKSISLYIQLDYTDYEEYYIIQEDEKLSVAPYIMWQNEVCANECLNIFNPAEDVEPRWIIDNEKNALYGIE